MCDRPKLKLVPGCGRDVPMNSGALFGGPEVRAQFVSANHAGGGALDQKGVLSGDPLLVLQPLPDRPLGDTNFLGERGLRQPLPLEVGFQVHGPILGDLVQKVNSDLVAGRPPPVHVQGMNTARRETANDGVPADVKKQEGEALARLWKLKRKRSQAEFASECGFSQSNFSHYIGGRQPIPLDIGIAIAEELGVKLADFSPRLAAELEAERAREARIWPFKHLRPDILHGLTRGQLMAVESAMLRQIEEFQAAPAPAARSQKG